MNTHAHTSLRLQFIGMMIFHVPYHCCIPSLIWIRRKVLIAARYMTFKPIVAHTLDQSFLDFLHVLIPQGRSSRALMVVHRSASLFGGGRLLLLVVLLLRLGVVSGVKRDLKIDLQGAKESY